jgi:STAS-like domain of unknown function (DUF4325)
MLYNIIMPLAQEQREEIKRFITYHVGKHPKDIVRAVIDVFGLSGQTVRNYILQMIADDILESKGTKRGTSYQLKSHEKTFALRVTPEIDESEVWRDVIVPFLPKLKENVFFICDYSFTEMLNNVKEHSRAEYSYIEIVYDALRIQLVVMDNGIGIFNKIQQDFGLQNKSDAILELAKGKLTSDPAHHTGEGIFFTSRLCDSFEIMSDDLFFFGHEKDDWILQIESFGKGTSVFMGVKRDSNLTPQEVFNKYANPEIDDYGFSRTHLPVKLLQQEGEALVSRSQAKRLVARLGKFKEVILDFDGVTRIGQAFADEIFRVFKNKNPEVNLTYVNATDEVRRTLNHVLSTES